MPSCSAITSTLPASNIIRRVYPPADEVCLLAGPERPLAQVTQDTSAWPELNVCWLVGMSLDPTCDLRRVPDNHRDATKRSGSQLNRTPTRRRELSRVRHNRFASP